MYPDVCDTSPTHEGCLINRKRYFDPFTSAENGIENSVTGGLRDESARSAFLSDDQRISIISSDKKLAEILRNR
jgi:hypothetical protein